MHKNTKLTPILRKEIFQLWKKEKYSLRMLGQRYHVDKRVIGRIIERGKKGDFSVHDSTNHRYSQKRANARVGSSKKRSLKKAATKKVSSSRANARRVVGGKKTTRKRITRG